MFQVALIVVEVALEVLEGELVAVLELAVVVALLLHRVVREVNHSISHIFERELFATRPQIPFIVIVALQIAIHGRDHCICADVELPILVEERPFHVFLDDIGPLLAVDGRVFDDFFDALQVFADVYSAAPIRVFARFHDPDGLAVLDEVRVVFHAENFAKASELLVTQSFLDVEGERHDIEGIFA